MTGDYCPFDIIRDPRRLGLTAESIDTSFGRTHVVHRPSGVSTTNGATVLLHGIGGTWSSWTPLLQAADAVGAELGPVVLFDLPGFGDSENAPGTLDSHLVGRMVLDTVAALGIAGPVRLVGQSMGAYLAVDMAARFGSEVSHLTALAGSFRTILQVGRHPVRFARTHPRATLGNVAYYLAGRHTRTKPVQDMLRRRGVEPLFDYVAARPADLRPSVRSALSTTFTPRNMMLAARNARHDDSSERWRHITAETSFVWGADDRLVPPSESDFVAATLPSAQRTVVVDAAHIVHIEKPYDVLYAVAGMNGLPRPHGGTQ